MEDKEDRLTCSVLEFQWRQAGRGEVLRSSPSK